MQLDLSKDKDPALVCETCVRYFDMEFTDSNLAISTDDPHFGVIGDWVTWLEKHEHSEDPQVRIDHLIDGVNKIVSLMTNMLEDRFGGFNSQLADLEVHVSDLESSNIELRDRMTGKEDQFEGLDGRIRALETHLEEFSDAAANDATNTLNRIEVLEEQTDKLGNDNKIQIDQLDKVLKGINELKSK